MNDKYKIDIGEAKQEMTACVQGRGVLSFVLFFSNVLFTHLFDIQGGGRA